jgi:AraC-like DNA-binding protein/mannose-6-phosphate isomerase-like protein (cupin superfamily)
MMQHAMSTSATGVMIDPANSLKRLGGHRYTTLDKPASHRLEWLTDVIGKEWANVEITPSKNHAVFNDILLYPWREGMRLSPIRSNPVCLSRMNEPLKPAHDCYNVVVLTSGEYKLEQAGREVFLKPGDMTLYDVTQPHRITIPTKFSKILISIPRSLLQQRVTNINDLTAKRIPTNQGIGVVTSSVIYSTVSQLNTLDQDQYMELANHVLDLFILSTNVLNGQSKSISRHSSLVLMRVKAYINCHLADSQLDASSIAEGVGLSIRYINNLFSKEGLSLMRYVTQQRLELSRRLLSSSIYAKDSITIIAMGCGFNNMAHFSRVYKETYGISPRAYRQVKMN